MKVIVVLTAMLWYEGSIIHTDTYTKDFLTHEECQNFTWFNNRYKPNIKVDSFKNTSLILESLHKIN